MRSALADLTEAALLEDAADDERTAPRDRARYDRQLRYFSDLAPGATPPSEYQRRHEKARVAMLGLGGLGSWAAYALACCGVGELVLVDGDRVEESNFNRQILYREHDVGRPQDGGRRRGAGGVRLGVPPDSGAAPPRGGGRGARGDRRAPTSS